MLNFQVVVDEFMLNQLMVMLIFFYLYTLPMTSYYEQGLCLFLVERIEMHPCSCVLLMSNRLGNCRTTKLFH